MIRRPQREKPCGDCGGRFANQIACDLQCKDSVAWQILVEGAHDPVTVSPGLLVPLIVEKFSVTVAVPRDIQSVLTPALPIEVQRQQFVNQLDNGRLPTGGAGLDERGRLFRRRANADQVQMDQPRTSRDARLFSPPTSVRRR